MPMSISSSCFLSQDPFSEDKFGEDKNAWPIADGFKPVVAADPQPTNQIKQLLKSGKLWLAASEDSLLKQNSTDKNSADKNKADKKNPGYQSSQLVATFGAWQIDQALPAAGLPLAGVHEWHVLQSQSPSTDSAASSADVFPPCSILGVLACNLMKAASALGRQQYLLWIGKSSWPSPYLLQQLFQQQAASINCSQGRTTTNTDNFLSRCLFLDPCSLRLKHWSIETALRSAAVLCVVSEMRSLSLSMSRRFSLAAQRGGGIGLFIRPEKEIHLSSAALSRWSLKTCPTYSDAPCWELQLFKQKGQQSAERNWKIEFTRSQLQVVQAIDNVALEQINKVQTNKNQKEKIQIGA